jgi:CHAD domain-containing protein
MNRTGRAGGTKSQTLRDRILSWRELVVQCGRKPTRKRVHALRVVTLRIQAEVENELSGLPRASHGAQAMMRFDKLAEKLRDALGSVRELDVWIGKLHVLRDSMSGSTSYVPRSSCEASHQLERLESRLVKKRERAGAKLVAEIEKRQDDLLQAARDLERATDERVDESDGKQLSKLLNEFTRIVDEYPALDEDNLHQFRKKVKEVRYVAEIHSAKPVCGRIAAHMKSAQAAIGEWHDWQVLARTARRGKHSKGADAVDLLNSLSAESYGAAIATCDGVLRRMADLRRYTDLGMQGARKPSVRDEHPVKVSMNKLA